MLRINDRKYFDEVCAFAAMKGPKHSEWLWERLLYLHAWGDRLTVDLKNVRLKCPLCDRFGLPADARDMVEGRTTVMLFKDFAPASFEWSAINDKGDVYYNGGLIYHGDQTGWRTKVGAIPSIKIENFAVRIGQEENPWGIHS